MDITIWSDWNWKLWISQFGHDGRPTPAANATLWDMIIQTPAEPLTDTNAPSFNSTHEPTLFLTHSPSEFPYVSSSMMPTIFPSSDSTLIPNRITELPSAIELTIYPTDNPTRIPLSNPTVIPTWAPVPTTFLPTTTEPTISPSRPQAIVMAQPIELYEFYNESIVDYMSRDQFGIYEELVREALVVSL